MTFLRLKLTTHVRICIWCIVLCFFLIRFATAANATILLEPYLSFSFKGHVEKKSTPEGPTHEWSYMGPGYGFRVGFDFVSLLLGLELSTNKQTWEGDKAITAGINDQPQEMNSNSLGLFIGTITSFGLIVRGTYFVMVNIEKKDHNGPYDQGDTYKGMGYSLALGYRFLPYLATTLEFRSFYMDRIKIASDAGKTYSLSDGREASLSEIMLTVSAPLLF
ncbi:MAG: hypothetical protein HQK50_15000 [Oligoflexia bacterium]|nr:hypothetical protein [Oligoflexia bacterium]MBF0366880.1 hypothetical protein [Oligoflexia bacterium]